MAARLDRINVLKVGELAEVPAGVLCGLFGRRAFDFPPTAAPATGLDAGPVRPETREAVLQLVSDRLKRPLTEAEQRPEARLDELGLDSLDRMELSLHVERQFGFSGEEAADQGFENGAQHRHLNGRGRDRRR